MVNPRPPGPAAPPQLWRILLGVGLISGLYIGLNTLGFAGYALLAGRAALGNLMASLSVASTPRTVLILMATFVPLALATYAVHRLLHRRTGPGLAGPRAYLAHDFAIAALVTVAVLGLPALLIALFGAAPPQRNLPAGLWLALLPLACLALGVQTLAEELLFRGYLQRQLAARLGPAPWARAIWLGLPALLFGALHLDPARMGAAAPYAVAAATLFGLIAADLTARTGGIGAAWGVHFANNMLAVTVLATSGTITGLARWVTPYDIAEVAVSPGLALLDALPLVAIWLLLRRLLPRRLQ